MSWDALLQDPRLPEADKEEIRAALQARPYRSPVLEAITAAAKPKPQAISAKRPPVPAALRPVPSHKPTSPKPAQLRAARPEEGGIDRFIGDVGSAWWDSNPREGDIEHNTMLQRPGGKLGAGLGVLTNIPSLKAGLVSVKAALAAEHALPVAGGVLSRLFKGKGVKPAGADRDALMRGVAGDLGEVAPQTPRPPAPPKKKTKGTTAAAPVAESAERVVPAAAPAPADPSKIDPNKYLNFKKLVFTEPGQKEAMEDLVRNKVVANQWVPKRVEHDTEFKARVAALGMQDIEQHLRPLGPGESIPGDVQMALKNQLDGAQDQLFQLRKQIKEGRDGGTLGQDAIAQMERQADMLEQSANSMLDVLIPARSQDGRNLRYHRFMAERSFDTSYWLGRADKAAKGVITDAEKVEISQGILVPARQIQADQTAMNAAAQAGNTAEADAIADRILQATQDLRDQGKLAKRAERLEAKAAAGTAQVEGLKEALTAAQERLKALSKERSSLLGKMNRAGQRISKKEEVVEDLRPQVEALAQEEKFLRETVSRLNKQNLALKARKAKGESKLTETQDSIQSLQDETDALAEKLGILKPEEAALRKTQRSLKGKIGRTEDRLTKLEQANAAAEDTLKESRRKLAEKMAGLDRTGLLDAIVIMRKAGLLSGPKTFMRNVGGNIGFQLMEEAARVPSSLVDTALAAGFGTERTVGGADFSAMLSAAKEGATRGVKEFGEVMQRGATADQLARLDVPHNINIATPTVMDAIRGDFSKPQSSKLLNAYVNGVFRFHVGTDRLFKTYAIERSLQEQAKILAKNAGLKGDDQTEMVKDLVDGAWNGKQEEMMARAIAEGDFATFNSPNKLAEGVQRMKAVDPNLARAVDLVVPFVKTPTNIISRVIDYSPIGGAIGLGKAAKAIYAKKIADESLKPEQQRAIAQAIGRGSVGTGIILMGYFMAQNNRLTGTYQAEPGTKGRNEVLGQAPISIRFGDNWHQIGSFSPWANLLGVGATLHREGVSVGTMTTAGVKTVLEQPLLSGVKTTIRDIERLGEAPQKLGGSLAGSFIPTAVSDIAGIGDEVRRKPSTIPESVMARVPGLRTRVPERTDPLGQALEEPTFAAVDPTLASRARETEGPLFKEIARLGPEMKIAPPSDKINLDLPGEPTYKLTPEEFNGYKKNAGDLAMRELAKLFAADEYQAAPESVKLERAKQIIESARAAVRNMYRARLLQERGIPFTPEQEEATP